jgi:hypothetical protein
MLQLADSPILMPKPDGAFAEEVTLAMPIIHRANQPGPSAWGQAVLAALQRGSPRRHRLTRKKGSRKVLAAPLRYGTW